MSSSSILKITPKKAKRGALVLAGTLALVFFNHPNRTEIWWLSIPIALLFFYAFSGWFTKGGLSPAERIGHGFALSIICFGGVFGYAWHFWPTPQIVSQQCSITAIASTDMAVRFYFRGKQQNIFEEHYYEASLQEWFYEWRLLLRASADVPEVSVTVKNILLDERPSIIPDYPFFEKAADPHWRSGFREMRDPDFYVGRIRFGPLPRAYFINRFGLTSGTYG